MTTTTRSSSGGPYTVNDQTWWYRKPNGTKIIYHEVRDDQGHYIRMLRFRVTDGSVQHQR